jgi:D-alanyl-D-alanine carboxypeptidase
VFGVGTGFTVLKSSFPASSSPTPTRLSSAPDHPDVAPPSVNWPRQGQAALVLGNDQPVASPDQQAAPIASLAKVMTAYVTLLRYPIAVTEEGFRITVTTDQAQAVAPAAAQSQSVVSVHAGEQVTQKQLLEALLIPSGNNIARMIAVQVAGSEARFVHDMNAEARSLGMHDTFYADASGPSAHPCADFQRLPQTGDDYSMPSSNVAGVTSSVRANRIRFGSDTPYSPRSHAPT